MTSVTEIRLRAERRTGELLRDMEKAPAGRPTKKSKSGNPSSQEEAFRKAPKLKELGITHNQSSLWQKLAAIPLLTLCTR